MKKILSLILLLGIFGSVSASHIAGAEIWYEHDTLNIYKVHLKLYRDCGGVSIGSTASVQVNSATITSPINLTLDTAGSNIPNNGSYVYTCMTNSCQNFLSPLPGLQMFHYVGTINLPNAAADWTFSYTDCCRNANNTVVTGNTFIKARLDNLNTPFNNGLSIPYSVPYYFSVNVSNNVSYAATELDGDSIDYRLTNAMINANAACSYINGNTFSSPFPNSSLSLNAQTGMLSFTPTAVGSYVLAIETREYRNGVLIGSSTRDHQVHVIASTPGNNLPNLSGINGGTGYSQSVNVCGTASFNFTINSSDIDVNDTTVVFNVLAPTGATVTTNVAQNQSASFSWNVTQADVRAQPYLLVLEVQDNNCAMRQEVYQLYVNNCNTDSVWAGDANADFTCDNYDILNIGIANGTTGNVRAGATTNWQAEWCLNWNNNFVSSINYKHADCNGDGVVNSADLASVAANYAQVHNKTSQLGQYKTTGLPDLYCDVNAVQAYKGSNVSIPVMLGSTASPMTDFYGISATVELLNAQTSGPISITKNNTWIGNAATTFLFDKNLQANKSAFTIVRNDQANQIGQGQIGTIEFPIDIASVVGSKVIVQFSDIKMIKNTGEELQDYNVLSDTLTVLAPNALAEVDNNFSVNVYPNPTKSSMTISLTNAREQDCQIALYDVVGRLIDNKIFSGKLLVGEHKMDVNLNDKAIGEYLLEIKTESGKTILPVQKR